MSHMKLRLYKKYLSKKFYLDFKLILNYLSIKINRACSYPVQTYFYAEIPDMFCQRIINNYVE